MQQNHHALSLASNQRSSSAPTSGQWGCGWQPNARHPCRELDPAGDGADYPRARLSLQHPKFGCGA